jgi:hypothetical protein
MNSCSCLTLLLACVIYWQAKEISRVLKTGVPEGEDIDISLLEHVSPIEWENVILYGQYVLNPDQIRKNRFTQKIVRFDFVNFLSVSSEPLV